MKKKVIILWGIFVVCVVMAVFLGVKMNTEEVEYEEVNVKVVSAVTKTLKNKSNGNSYDFYEVKVEYEGKTYDLGNPHNVYQYPEGSTVKALLSNGKLYANVEGIKSTTPLAKVYFVFLFGSFIMLFVALFFTGKLSQKKKDIKTAPEEE